MFEERPEQKLPGRVEPGWGSQVCTNNVGQITLQPINKPQPKYFSSSVGRTETSGCSPPLAPPPAGQAIQWSIYVISAQTERVGRRIAGGKR